MMWVSVVHIESDTDPGAELLHVLKETFGQSTRTRTLQAWLHDAEREPARPMGKPQSKTTVLPRGRLR